MGVISAGIIAVGNELLNGKVVDTNSALLAGTLERAGIRVERVVLVADVAADIAAELERQCAARDLVLLSGGLGPTTDDLTRDAIAMVAGVSLEPSSASLERLEQRALRRGVPLTENSKRQALFPAGAEILANPVGTADAFILELARPGRKAVPIISLPGVPFELETIFVELIEPRLERFFPERERRHTRSMRFFGRSEAFIGSAIESLQLDCEIEVAYRPIFPEILVTFSHSGGDAAILEAAAERAAAAVGEEFVLNHDGEGTLVEAVSELLRERGLTLAAAESCSGGLLAHRLISAPGASSFFLASLVTYTNESKSVFLGVKRALLADKGAVSEPVAIAMAKGARYRVGADIGISITGIAGPDGGTPEKPVGTVCIGLALGGKAAGFRYQLPWGRNAVRAYSVGLALDLIRRELLGYPLQFERR